MCLYHIFIAVNTPNLRSSSAQKRTLCLRDYYCSSILTHIGMSAQIWVKLLKNYMP